MTTVRPIFDLIVAGDYGLMRRVNRWRAPRWVRLWMTCATRGGDGWLWYTLGALLLLFGGQPRLEAVGALLQQPILRAEMRKQLEGIDGMLAHDHPFRFAQSARF